MRSISDTIARLGALKTQHLPLPGADATDGLTELYDFGSNPGALRARTFLPSVLADGAPLVLVLHGCTQTAAGYDRGSGWSRLAERDGFALLFPEQRRENNPNLCFNWFAPGDIRRGAGEALSIAQMIDALVTRHGIDRQRVFITGLSAGGAMAGVMLATYPELFAAGAIIAGLPYSCAASIPEAFDRMRGQGLPATRDLQAALASASPHAGAWPRLSVWHGDADLTVDAANAEAILAQWSGVLGVANPDRTEMIGRHRRQIWRDASGVEVMENMRIAGMGHGTPLDPRIDGGAAGPFMLDVGISSTLSIARFWGISDGREIEAIGETAVGSTKPGDRLLRVVPANAERPAKWPRMTSAGAKSGVAKTIEDALRAAGLMR